MRNIVYSVTSFADDFLYNDKVKQALGNIFIASRLRAATNKVLAAYFGEEISFELMNEEVVFDSPNFEEFMVIRSFKSDKQILKDICGSLDEDEVFYDIGANIGLYTCSIGSVTGCDVYSFEPHPKNAQKLRHNADMNEVSCEMVEKVISDVDGTERINIGKDVSGEGQVNLTVTEKGREVESSRLDSLIDEKEIPSPDVVKIDVEGAEIKVVRGMEELPESKMPERIYCEIHSTVRRYDATPEDVEEELQDLGYEVETLEEMFGNRKMVRADKN